MEKQKTKMVIGSVETVKSGTSTKDGKSFNWTIQKVSATSSKTGKEGSFSTFDDFRGREEQELEVEIWQETNEKNGKTYKNWKIALPKKSVWEVIRELESRVKALEDNQLGKEEAEATGEIGIDDLGEEEVPDDF